MIISDSQIRSIARFYLFSLMDEKTALDAAHRTIAHLKAVRGPTSKANSADDSGRDIDEIQLIRILAKSHKQYRKQLSRNRPPTAPTETAWQYPVGFDISIWAKFQKDAGEPEVVAVLLSKILGFSDSVIAEGLNVSVGTARYRVGKGIRQLGSLAQRSART
jgi:hypothetical protein